MYEKGNMETYITICKIDSQQEFAVWLRKLKQGLCINLEGWDGEGDEGRFKREGIYAFLCLIQVGFHKFAAWFTGLFKSVVLRCVIGGIALGGIGTLCR